jgi:hypothetical protein
MRGGQKRLAAPVIALCLLIVPVTARALVDDVFSSDTQPASTLLVPFDVTENLQTYIQVSNPYGVSSAGVPQITTHWAFWSESCIHLFDTSICLTINDTIIVDPRSVAAVNVANDKVGPVADLSGERGFVTVTAYATDESCSGPETLGSRLVDNAIVGLVTLADGVSTASVGLNAIGLGLDPTGSFVDLPNQLLSPTAGNGSLDILTSPVEDLDVARVIYLAVAENTGMLSGEIGPIGEEVTAAATFIDNLEVPISLPDVSIECARFGSLRSDGESPLLPPTVTITSSGIFRLTSILADGSPVGDGDGQNGNDTWVYGAYAQQLGPFGAGSRAKYEVVLSDGQPAPTPRPTATPLPTVTAPGATATPRPSATPRPPATPTPRPSVGSPTPRPTATPARTPTPRPTSGGTPTPAPSPSVGGPTCERAVLTVTVNYTSNAVSGTLVRVDYPSSVSVPGFLMEPPVLAAVENLTGMSGGLFSANDEDSNPADTFLNIGLVSIGTPIPAGAFARVTFDCESGTPRLADFACDPDVSNSLGVIVSATCELALQTQ